MAKAKKKPTKRKPAKRSGEKLGGGMPSRSTIPRRRPTP